MVATYDVEQVRKEWIGRETDVMAGMFPVEYDPIRRYCHMVGDLNPLHLDPAYARSLGYRDVVCPAAIVRNFALPQPWPPGTQEQSISPPRIGSRAINLTNEMMYLKPVCVGDRLSAKMRLSDIYMKPIRLDPKAVWTVTDLVILRDGEEVFLERNIGLFHRAPEEVAADTD